MSLTPQVTVKENVLLFYTDKIALIYYFRLGAAIYCQSSIAAMRLTGGHCYAALGLATQEVYECLPYHSAYRSECWIEVES